MWQYPIGYFRGDFAELQIEEGKHNLFVAVDHTSKVAFAELYPRTAKLIAADFLRPFVETLSRKVLMARRLATWIISPKLVDTFLTASVRSLALNIDLPSLYIPG